MKLLLVATNRETAPFPVAPLGALCVAAAARAAGHAVTFLDLGPEANPHRALRRALARDDYEVVGFSIRNLDNCSKLSPRGYVNQVLALAETVRKTFSGPFILGGSGFSVSPRGWMQRLPVDWGLVGEGERAVVEMLARLEAGQSLDGIAGVMAKPPRRTAPLVSAEAAPVLGELGLPAHELCRYPSYLKRGGFVSVQTKRGCPHQCIYCVYPRLDGRRYRLRPPELVAEEVEAAVKPSGARHYFLVDGVFNEPRAHALAVCAALERRQLAAKWMAFCNPVGFDAELAHAMARAGCEGVEFGLDAAIPKMLAAMRKPFGQAEIRTAFQAAQGAKLPFAVYLLFGGPGETWADVEETQRFLSECAPANSIFASLGIRIYEDTGIAEIARQEGAIGTEQDLFEPTYYLSPAMAHRPWEQLDRIVRQREEWTSPVDWRRPLMRGIQKVMNFMDVRPQWRDVRGYGRHMRR